MGQKQQEQVEGPLGWSPESTTVTVVEGPTDTDPATSYTASGSATTSDPPTDSTQGSDASLRGKPGPVAQENANPSEPDNDSEGLDDEDGHGF